MELIRTPPTWTLGDRIAKARSVAQNMSGETLGKLLGVTKATVSNWEVGHSKPSLQQLELIEMNTGCPLWWLAGYEHDPGREVIVREYRARNVAQEDAVTLRYPPATQLALPLQAA